MAIIGTVAAPQYRLLAIVKTRSHVISQDIHIPAVVIRVNNQYRAISADCDSYRHGDGLFPKGGLEGALMSKTETNGNCHLPRVFIERRKP